MELLLLVAAIVVLGIWVGWHEYRLNKIRDELSNTNGKVSKHDRALYGERYFSPFPFFRRRDDDDRSNGIYYRLGVIERKLRAAEDQERVERRKAEMKEYLRGDAVDDNDIDKLYDMAHGVSIDEDEWENEEK